MKILIFSQYFYPENFRVNNMSEILCCRGHEVTVVTGYPQYPQGVIYDEYGFDIPYDNIWNGVHLVRLKVKPRGKNALNMLINCYSYVNEANKWVANNSKDYDIIYVFGVSPPTVALPAIKYAKQNKIPVIYNALDLWPENVEHILGVKNKMVLKSIDFMMDYIYKNCDLILCSSNSFVRNINNRGVPNSKTLFWPQFSEVFKFHDDIKRLSSKFTIVFTGNIGTSQGLDNLIEAIDLIKQKDIVCYIVGDGREYENLVKKVNKLNLIDQIVFTGKVSEKEASLYIKKADVAYLSFADNPILDMTIPAKLQTYMSCGTFILAALGGECAQIIKDVNCGLVVDKDPVSISDAIKKLLDDYDDSLGKNGYEYFLNNFTTDIVIDKLENEMKKLVSDI